jgi:cyanophycinase
VVVPTAGEGEDFDDFYPGLGLFRHMGARKLSVLHTRDRDVADSESFVEPLREARAVWFSGGRQWRLAEAYVGTRTHEELRALLDRGGVIGGSSAGASILASFLVRGDPRTNEIVMGEYQQGFGFLPASAIDQHLLARNRQFDLIPVVQKYPELLGIGIDENTAIVVEGDEFEVIGESYVLIYDNRTTVGDRGRFYFLAPGDQFDLATREATRSAQDRRPVEGVERKPWGGG